MMVVMKRFVLPLAACLLVSAAAAQDAAEPSLNDVALDGVRTCMSIADGRPPADAAAIFNFKPVGETYVRETARGKVEIQPPTADRKTCRTQVYALTLQPNEMIDAVKGFLTTPPQSYAAYQTRVGEDIGGGYAARVSIWASSDGASLGQVTLYEVIANEYYHGPKILIDFIVNKRAG